MTAQDRYASLSQQKMVVVSGDKKLSGSLHSIREIFQHREMLSLLIRRDLKSRYKDSALGFTWTLVRPLTQLLIYYIVMGKFLGAERGLPDFAVYVFTGLTAYGFFSEMISGTTASIVENSGLIKKIYLPREVFPLASIGSALFNFAIQLIILLGATVVASHFPISPNIVYFFPAVLMLLIYGLALGLLLSAVNVYLRDVQYLVEVVLLLLLWASPIVYSWTMVRGFLGHSWMLDVYTNNPITLAVLGFQRSLWLSGSATAEYPDHLMMRLWVAIAVGLVMVVAFQRVFARLQGNFAQEL
jgi:ABC-2 type transport system permease protein